MRRHFAAAALFSMIFAGSAHATYPVPDGGGGGTKVHTLKPWKATHLYRVQKGFHVRAEQQLGARQPGAIIQKGTWLRITCQRSSRSSTGSRLWSGVAGGFVPDSAMKTYTDGRLAGAPT